MSLKLTAASAFLMVLGLVGWRVVTHNEDVVVPGQLYRSAQLDRTALSHLVQTEHIRTVLNLRGKNQQARWYQDEIEVCRTLGIHHLDLRWSAQHLPPPLEVEKLLEAYRQMPRPLLLHCRSGSDRTGLACSIFLIDQENFSSRKAAQSLSWWHGHFSVYPYFEMDEFIQLYSQDKKISLADWVAKDYPSIYAAEAKESKWDEIMEPFELAFRGSL